MLRIKKLNKKNLKPSANTINNENKNNNQQVATPNFFKFK